MSHPHQREVAVFEAALQLPPEQREAYLQQTCAGDPDLLRRIRALLEAEGSQSDFLAPAAPAASLPLSEQPGDVIGPYKLLQQIGEGGCGVVYMAEQDKPLRRRVALKIIKLGMDTRHVVARFEAERQALALMDHPNIAKVHDAGATVTGRPYFVMELVRGVKITDYCDEKQLSTRQRLELFMQVCQAVQHAHQKGIIHRDLKPSNILVTVNDGVAVPKVIDFGIAKATSGERLTDKTVFTAFEQFIGTPAYMSPEQAEITSVDIDTRSDIYSLGVLLYELLTGQTPFDAKDLLQAGLDEMRRTLREKEPARPSTRLRTLAAEELTTTAQRRGLEPPKLLNQVSGDLDWIVMKCLEKDRARRYETANGLATDIQRHLSNEPVAARPPSRLYEFQKTVRRHKLGFAATAAVILALALGLSAALVELARARHAEAGERVQRQQAQQNAIRAEKLARDEQQQRQRAELLSDENQKDLYAAHIGLAHQAFEDGDVAYAIELLKGLVPQPGKQDLRGFEWYYLWRLCHGEKLALQHPQIVYDVAFSPDGKTLAVACRDQAVWLWDAESGRQLFKLTGHTQQVRAVAFSPDGSLLASGSADKTVRLWAVTNGELLGVLTGHTEAVRALAFSPDGRTLASGTAVITQAGGNPSERYTPGPSEGGIKLWDVRERRERLSLPTNGSPVLRLAFSPDGGMLLAGLPRRLDLWDVRTGRLKGSLTNFAPAQLKDFAIQPGTRTVAAATWFGHSKEGKVRLWDLDSLAEKTLPLDSVGRLLCLAFSPDGKVLATSGVDSVITLWDSSTGAELYRFAGHTSDIRRLTFANDGRRLASAGRDQTVRVWDLNQPQKPQVIASTAICTLDFSPDGRYLASAGGRVEVREALTGQLVRQASVATNNGDFVVRFSPDGSYLAGIESSGGVHFWDVATWTHRAPPSPHAGWDHLVTIHDLVFTPDGGTLITGSTQPWDVATARPIQHASFTDMEGWALGFDAEAGTFLTVIPGKAICVWDAFTFALRTKYPVPPAGVYWPQLSPDGKQLAVLTERDNEVALLALPGGQEIRRFKGHKDFIWHHAFSHDGKTLATASWDGTVRLWQMASGREMLRFRSPDGPGWCVAFSPDDRMLAFGSGSSTAGYGSLSILRAEPEPGAAGADARNNATARVIAAYRATADRYRSEQSQPMTRERFHELEHIVPRPPDLPPQMLDLTPYYTKGLGESVWFRPTPQTALQKVGGVEFDVRGLILLDGRQFRQHGGSLPASALGIPVHQRARRLHFLHAVRYSWDVPHGTPVGDYVIHYEDGTKAVRRLEYERDIRDWNGEVDDAMDAERAKTAWAGLSPAGVLRRLYLSTWENPRPDAPIATLDIVTPAGADSSLSVTAISVE